MFKVHSSVYGRRLAAVELFSTQQLHCEVIANLLRSCVDLERVIQKVRIVVNITRTLSVYYGFLDV